MRVFKFFSLFLLCCIISCGSSAKPITVLLKLAAIKANESSSQSNDDLYFSLSQYSNMRAAKDFRVPVFPSHWISKQFTELKDVVLWEGELKEDEKIKLIISLVEQDYLPFDSEGGIGSAELSLYYHKGMLTTKWGVPDFESSEEVEQLSSSIPQHYIFKGSESKYDVAFLVEEQ